VALQDKITPQKQKQKNHTKFKWKKKQC